MNVGRLTASSCLPIFRRVVSRSFSSATSSFSSSSFRVGGGSSHGVGIGLVRRQQHRSAVPWVVHVVAGRGNKSSAMRGVKKENLPTKICVVCNRPFTWRKKWERCWDEVTTCSKSCNASRKRDKNGNNNSADADASDEDGEGGAGGRSDGGGGGGGNGRDAKREQRKANKKAVKASKRSKRAGGGGGDGEGVAAEQNNNDDGRKSCDGCGKRVDLLIRCQDDGSKRWKMLCGGKCWKNASGGVPDGDADHPHYRYGGLWKNRRAGRHVSTAVPALNDDGEPASSSSSSEEEEAVEVEVEVGVGREEEEKEKDADRQLAGLQLA